MADTAIPEGFSPIFRRSNLLDLLGPFYQRGTGADMLIAFRAEEKHANMRGYVHGGVLASLADIALGYVTVFGTEPPRPFVTVSLTINYTSAARIGDWIEARVDWVRTGRTMAFANCFLTVGETPIAHASAVFSAVGEGS
jgi:uncharacterized protein (TIGR00369 family)